MVLNSRKLSYVLAAAAAFGAIGVSIRAQAQQSKALPSSIPNRPWPAPVQKVPDVQPALSPEDALKTFYMPPGYRIELVAAAFHRMPARRLVVVGDGPQRSELEQELPEAI